MYNCISIMVESELLRSILFIFPFLAVDDAVLSSTGEDDAQVTCLYTGFSNVYRCFRYDASTVQINELVTISITCTTF